jgi:hypothetical protein
MSRLKNDLFVGYFCLYPRIGKNWVSLNRQQICLMGYFSMLQLVGFRLLSSFPMLVMPNRHFFGKYLFGAHKKIGHTKHIRGFVPLNTRGRHGFPGVSTIPRQAVLLVPTLYLVPPSAMSIQ